MQGVEFADIFRRSDHVLCGEDLLLAAGLHDRNIGDGPGMRGGSQGKGVDTNAVADRAGLTAAEPERQTHGALGYAGLNDDRRIDLPSVRGQGNDIAGTEREFCRVL